MLAFAAISMSTATAALNDGLVFALDLSKGDANENGYADPAEIANRMDFSSDAPATVSVKSIVDDVNGNETVMMTEMPVYDPWFGLNSLTNDLPCLYFPQTVKTVDGVTCCAAEYVAFNRNFATSDCTIHVRFKWDGNTVPDSHNCFIAMNGYSWSNNRGWGLGLYEWSSVSTEADLLVMVGKQSVRALKLYSGEWYDAVCTMEKVDGTNCNVTCYLCRENGYRSKVESFSGKLFSASITPSNIGFWLGGENRNESGWRPVSANTAKNVFRGAIADVKLWNRVLNADEVNLLFSGLTGERWNVGAENGGNSEFGVEDAAPDVFNVDTDSWSAFPRALTDARQEFTVSAPWQASENRLPQILSVTPILSDEITGSCPVEVSVNGRVAGAFDLAKQTQFRIKKRFVVRGADGRLYVKLRRLTSNGTLGIDAVSLSGSFQIGTRNNTNQEFTTTRRTGQTFVAGDTNTKHFVDALWHNNSGRADGANVSAYSNVCIYAHIPVEATKAPMTFRTRLNCRGTQNEPVHSIGLYVNGARKILWTGNGSNAMQDFSYDFAAGEMPSGLVSFMLSDDSLMPGATSQNRWAYIDFVTLEATGNPDGTVITLK